MSQTPLGALKNKIHKKIDWLWKEGGMTRTQVYRMITHALGGRFFHVSDLTLGEAQLIWERIKNL